MTVSFIVPSVGRASLARTLASIETQPGDEILVVSEVDVLNEPSIRHIPCTPGKDWGSAERNAAMPLARGDYLSFMDDDDTYAPGHRAFMDAAIHETPGVPLIFRMRFPNGLTIWYENDREIRCGNVGTPMIVVPNAPSKLGVWGSQWGGDFMFIDSLRWPKEEFVWRSEVLALIGHDV